MRWNIGTNEYKNVIIRGSDIDVEFRRIMKCEVEEVWRKGKEKNKEKVDRLIKKYVDMDENGNVRDVIVTDDKLIEMNEHVEKNVKMYGGVQINEEEATALKVDPEYRVYKRIDDVDIEVEIEKGCTKARYHFMSEKKITT